MAQVKTVEMLLSKTRQVGECLLWTGAKCSSGYGTVRHGGRVESAHRLLWTLTNGNPGNLCVLHTCDKPSCLQINHLFLGTVEDNNHDRHRKGRYADRAKLTEEVVSIIRVEYASGGGSMKRLAQKYGVTAPTICRAVNRQMWRQVT